MKKILIIQTAFIGDVILATALIEKLKVHFPKGELHFLLRKGNETLLQNNPHISQILIWDKTKRKYGSYFSNLKIIRNENYTHVINLHRFFSSGLLTVFSRAGETIGFDKNPLSIFYSKRIIHQFGTEKNPIHEVERNLNLIEYLTDNKLVKPKIYPSKEDFSKVKTESDFITISPGSVWFTKQWPSEKWIIFIDRVGEDKSIYLLGGKGEFELCQSIKTTSNHPNVINKAGQLSFLESAALMSQANMNFVNDSAPLHLASAVNAPVTVVFCSTIPGFGFTPLSNNSIVIETDEKLACRPCGLHGKKSCPKGHFKCSEISIERLLDRLK